LRAGHERALLVSNCGPVFGFGQVGQGDFERRIQTTPKHASSKEKNRLQKAPLGFTVAASCYLDSGVLSMHFLAMFMQSGMDPAAIQRLAMTILALIPILIAIGLTIVIVPFWFILKKAGFSPWLSLINIIPLGTLFLYYFLAFAEWNVMPVPEAQYVPPVFPPQPPPQPPAQA
jgi:hypothetical protein